VHRRRAVVGLVGALVVIIGIVVAWPRDHARPTGTTVTLKNFSIEAPDTIRAGSTTFVAFGEGPSMHELNIAETDYAPNHLPTHPDGTIDDTSENPAFRHVAEAEGIDIGDDKALTADLVPGHYVLYCNMEGHYQAGMVKELEVTP